MVTYCYLNLDRPNVGGAWAGDSQYLYGSFASAVAGTTCTVHTEAGAVDPNDPSGELEPGTDPEHPGGETGDDDPGGQPSTGPDPSGSDDPGGSGSSSSSSSGGHGTQGGEAVQINPETGRPYGY